MNNSEMLPGVTYVENNYALMIENALGVTFNQRPLMIDSRYVDDHTLFINSLIHPRRFRDYKQLRELKHADLAGAYMGHLHTYILNRVTTIGPGIHENMHGLVHDINPDFEEDLVNREDYWVRRCVGEGIAMWGEVAVTTEMGDLNLVPTNRRYLRQLGSNHFTNPDTIRAIVEGEKNPRFAGVLNDLRQSVYFIYSVGHYFAMNVMIDLVKVAGLSYAKALELYIKHPPRTVNSLGNPHEHAHKLLSL